MRIVRRAVQKLRLLRGQLAKGDFKALDPLFHTIGDKIVLLNRRDEVLHHLKAIDIARRQSAFGFTKPDGDASYESMKSRVMDQIQRVFRPEFLNRLDDTIIFRHLNKEDLKKVIDFEMTKVLQRLHERGLELILTDEAKEFIIKQGSDLDYGARPLRRAIEQRVEDPLAEELLRGAFEGKNTITVEAIKGDDGKITRLEFKGEVRDQTEAAEPAAAAGA